MQASVVLADIDALHTAAGRPLAFILERRIVDPEYRLEPMLVDALAGGGAGIRQVDAARAGVHVHAMLRGHPSQVGNQHCAKSLKPDTRFHGKRTAIFIESGHLFS